LAKTEIKLKLPRAGKVFKLSVFHQTALIIHGMWQADLGIFMFFVHFLITDFKLSTIRLHLKQ